VIIVPLRGSEVQSDDYEAWPEEKLFALLASADIDRPAGFAIEVYRERFPISERAVPVLEKFLVSRILDNRSAAIEALVNFGNRTDYVVDALVLHFLSRDEIFGTPHTYAALSFLQHMSELGNRDAERAMTLLRLDPYVIRMTHFSDQSHD
jgi:hypothetical protein